MCWLYSNVWACTLMCNLIDGINERVSSANNLTLKSEALQCRLHREDKAIGQGHYLAALHKKYCAWLIHDNLFV